MPFKYPQFPGTIIRCDFSAFKEPEMTKIRPAIILSPKIKDEIRTTYLVVPLSSKEPDKIHKYHIKLSLPGVLLPHGLSRECWMKGDMIYSLSPKRMDLYRLGKDKNSGNRVYYTDRFSGIELQNIRKAIMHAIGVHLD